jgi:ABC-type spermidine/putrescine transport system permease subunit II
MRAALYLVGGLTLGFLVLPVFVVLPLGFSASPYLEFPPAGFSVRWYVRYFDSARWMAATLLSVQIAAGTTALALAVGVPAAFALVRRDFRGKSLLLAFFMAPIIVPYIITAIAVYFLFARLGLVGNPVGLLTAHTLLAVPKVLVIVAAALKGFDRTLERASMSLGAGPWTTFYRVTYPAIRPAVITAALFAFLTSFDELILSMFITGPSAVTLPKLMWDAVRLEIDPTIAAASSLLIAVAVLVLGTIEVLRRRAGIRVPVS